MLVAPPTGTMAALIVLLLALSTCQLSLAGNSQQESIKEMNELIALAIKLEPAAKVFALNQIALETADQRRESLIKFSRTIKSELGERYYEIMLNISKDYESKAHQYIDESLRRKNWFQNMMQFAGPLGNMKNLAKNDAFLAALTEKYEQEASKGLFKHSHITCDQIKFRLKALNAVLFTLQSDINFLVTEERQPLNEAILKKLQEDKFKSSHNFYNQLELTGAQKKFLFHYYTGKVDPKSINLAEALEHFYRPGEFITGRLLDSCQSVVNFGDKWLRLAEERDKKCEDAASAPTNTLFPDQFETNKYELVFSFCSQFYAAF